MRQALSQQTLSSEALDLCGPAHNYDRWLGYVAQHACTYVLEERLPARSRFELHARSRSAQGFTLARITSSLGRCRVLRGAAQIASDGQERYGLHISLSGSFEITQFGRNLEVAPGSYAFVSTAEPALLGNGGDNDTIVLFMPREFVDQRIVCGEDICARPNTPGLGLHSLVVETIQSFEKNAWSMNDDDFQRSARVFAELVLLAVHSAADLQSGKRSVRAANIARAKLLIRQRLSDPDLTLAEIAQASGLSLSYLHDLFRSENCTMWEYLKSARLQRARELLDYSSYATTVTEVSVECGFSSTSYFSTAFKRAFGLSPKDVLQGAASQRAQPGTSSIEVSKRTLTGS